MIANYAGKFLFLETNTLLTFWVSKYGTGSHSIYNGYKSYVIINKFCTKISKLSAKQREGWLKDWKNYPLQLESIYSIKFIYWDSYAQASTDCV